MLLRRLIARYIDNFSILIASFLLGFGGFLIAGIITQSNKIATLIFFCIFVIAFIIVYVIDFIVLPKKTGSTVGKRVLRLKIINDNGSDLKYSQLIIREIIVQAVGFFGIFGVILLLMSYSGPQHKLFYDSTLDMNVVKR
ncbi:MAG: RDD family protein [Candidatus Dojkabacteria bacterium]